MKKKSPEADLERKRPYFFKIGLIVACSLVWFALEWETAYASTPLEHPETEVIDDPYEDEVLKVLRFKKEEPKPPVTKKKSVEKIIKKTIADYINIVDEPIDDDDFGDDEPIEIEDPDEVEEELIIMAAVQFKPRFPGCEDAGGEEERFTCFQESIMGHIKSNFKYPEISKTLGIEGKVYVKFIIDKTGEINNIDIVRSADKYLDAEAKRLINILPKMIPARQFNKAVAVEYVVPINFILN